MSPGRADTLDDIWGKLPSSSGPIVLFGDSTTAARGKIKTYGELLEAALRAKHIAVPVINAGVPGNTTSMASKRFEKDVLAHHPSVVVIQFGINDAAVDVWKNPPASAPRVSLDVYRKNLESFVRQAKAQGAQVILMTPNRLRWSSVLLEKYGKAPYLPEKEDGANVVLDTYAQAVREIAKAEDVPLVDIQSAYAQRSDTEVATLLLSDGMHPSDQGHALVYRLLISHFESASSQQVP